MLKRVPVYLVTLIVAILIVFIGLVSFSLKSNEKNLERVIELSKERNSSLIFMTQPYLWKEDMTPEENASLWMTYDFSDNYYPTKTMIYSMEEFNKRLKELNVKNAYFDFGLPRQCEDEEIYQKAISDNRFVVTINFDDFKQLIKSHKPGIIGIRSQLTNADIDALLTRFVSINRVENCIGKAIKI